MRTWNRRTIAPEGIAGLLEGGVVPRPPTTARRARRDMRGTLRSVRSSETWTRARVRFVGSRGRALRHAREGDEQDVWIRACVDDLVHFARSLDERLPGGVRGALTLAPDRLVHRERAVLDDHDRASRMRVPTRGAARVDGDLRDSHVRSGLERDRPV